MRPASAAAGFAAPAWRVALLLLAWLAFSAGWRPLMLPDEGRYVGVAWEMLRSGQWAVPTLDGLPFFHKPPLFYWLSAGAMQLFGVTAWAARVPSLLGGLLAGIGLFLFTRRWGGGDERARWALLVLATQPFFHAGAQFANLDMLVAGCIAATVLLGAHAALLAAQGLPHRAPLLAAYAMAAAGVLAKGLIGFVLPGAALGLWLLLARQPRLLWRLVSLPGLLIFLVLALPWFVAMQLRYPGFFDYFVVYHHFRRFAEAGFNNQQPFWFYAPVLLLLALPWTLALPAAWRRREPVSAQPSVRLLMLVWLGVVMVFFSLPKSKLVGYVLPALPPLAWWLSGALLQGGWARYRQWIAGVAALACLSIVAGVALAHLRGDAALGRALEAARQAGEPVVFVGRYPYDVPFYGQLDAPVQVLDDWQSPGIPRHDDWRKELYDAGRFDPAAAQRVLLGREALPALLCAHERSWLVASSAQLQADPLLQGAREVARVKDTALWALPRRALNCDGTPNAGSAGR
jgi:4-amino-4-deoxy-L-arabinose transferase-like glycosyltransferase